MKGPATLFLTLISTIAFAQGRTIWKVERSLITFKSEAPLETIKAGNSRALGALDLSARSFAVQVPVGGFEGFNSPLQREHFNENYLDSDTWPHATFTGRIIEGIDLTVPGTYAVRAKGTLTIRDVSRERIVPCSVVVTPRDIRITSNMDVVLDEHGIRIPRVVQQKIAPVVGVGIDLLFVPEVKPE